MQKNFKKNTSTPYKELMIYCSIYDIKVNM